MAGEPYLYPISISPIFCIPCLLDLGYVYDLTVAYPYAVVESELRIATGHSPREVHFHVRRWPVSQLPKPIEVSRLASESNNEKTTSPLARWLQERWAEKEQMLKEYYG